MKWQQPSKVNKASWKTNIWIVEAEGHAAGSTRLLWGRGYKMNFWMVGKFEITPDCFMSLTSSWKPDVRSRGKWMIAHVLHQVENHMAANSKLLQMSDHVVREWSLHVLHQVENQMAANSKLLQMSDHGVREWSLFQQFEFIRIPCHIRQRWANVNVSDLFFSSLTNVAHYWLTFFSILSSWMWVNLAHFFA